jgi:hypothetical protein
MSQLKTILVSADTPTWRSLSNACPNVPIKIAGPSSSSENGEILQELVLGGTPLSSNYRGFLSDSTTASVMDGTTLGIIGYSHYAKNMASLIAVAVAEDMAFVAPNRQSIRAGHDHDHGDQGDDHDHEGEGEGVDGYPLSFGLYMYIKTSALPVVRPFIEYAFSDPGTATLRDSEAVPLVLPERKLMLSITESEGGIDLSLIKCGNGQDFLISGFPEFTVHMGVWALFYQEVCGTEPIIEASSNAIGITELCDSDADIAIVDDMPDALRTDGSDGYSYACRNGGRKVVLLQFGTDVHGHEGNVFAARNTIAKTTGFLHFGFSNEGIGLLEELLGVYAYNAAKQQSMVARIPSVPPIICFPGTSTVELEGTRMIPMGQLKIGDRVRTTLDGGFSEVYSFGHYDRDIIAPYLKIETTKFSLEISPSHMIFVADTRHAVAASFLQIGDRLEGGDVVVKISTVFGNGAYAPFTYDGTIVVNGVKASNYVDVVSTTVSIPGIHSLEHAAVAPRRWACKMGVVDCAKETYNQDGLATWASLSYKLYGWCISHYLGISITILCVTLLADGNKKKHSFQ